jgi:hypothetical protein
MGPRVGGSSREDQDVNVGRLWTRAAGLSTNFYPIRATSCDPG